MKSIFLFLVVLAILTGCGGGSSGNDSNTSSTVTGVDNASASEEEPETEEQEPVTEEQPIEEEPIIVEEEPVIDEVPVAEDEPIAETDPDSLVPYVPPECNLNDKSLPPNAPALEVGVWTNISPPPFEDYGDGKGALTQGMAIDPCNPAILYLTVPNVSSCNELQCEGIFRTTDAGSTWSNVGQFESPVRVRVDPRDPLHLYVGDGVAGQTSGFWETFDGGVTWNQPVWYTEARQALGAGSHDIYDVRPDPNDFNHVLLTFHSGWGNEPYNGGNGNSGILESPYNGEDWKAHPAPTPDFRGGANVFFLYDPSDPNNIIGSPTTWLFGTQDQHGYWRTDNAGMSWQKVSAEGQNMAHGGGQIQYGENGRLYVTSTYGILASDDNGATFDFLNVFGIFVGLGYDGTNLYVANLVNGPMLVAPEAGPYDWLPGPSSPDLSNGGAFEFVYDEHNHILYSASTGSGLWALKVSD